MLSIIANAGYATAVVDFTNDYSPLLVGLFGMTAFAAAMIIAEIVRYRVTHSTAATVNVETSTIDYQRAA